MGSCGLPLPGLAVRLVDPATGRDVDPPHEGELIVRGPNVMPGYRNKPDETRAALREGWYHTGDLARSDELEPVIAEIGWHEAQQALIISQFLLRALRHEVVTHAQC